MQKLLKIVKLSLIAYDSLLYQEHPFIKINNSAKIQLQMEIEKNYIYNYNKAYILK